MCDLKEKVTTNNEYRQKIIETVCLFWVFILVGFDNGILGPCIPDLQAWAGVSLEQMSYIFFMQGMGALLGNVLGFVVEPRCDRRLLMGIYVLLGSVANILIPLIPHFGYLLALFLLQGITKGQADFGAMSLCNVLWEHNKALPFQFIVVGAGISTFISPFIAQPFISDLPFSPSPTSSSSSSQSCYGRHSNKGHRTNLTSSEVDMELLSNVTRAVLDSSINSDIKWPFIIVGSVALPAAVLFFYFYFTKPPWYEYITEVEISDDVKSFSEDETRKPLLSAPTTFNRHSRTAVLFRVLVILLNLPVFGLLLTFADLLTSIGMASPVCMTAVEASYFNTVLWGAAMIGRAVSAIILICVSMSLQLLLGSVALVVMGVVLVVFSFRHSVVLWFGTAGVALFVTPSMPGFIAWSGDYLPITPFFMNLCLCAAGIGEMVVPFLGGQLMARYGSWYMMLFSLLIMIAMLLLFLLASYVARRIHRPRQ